MEVGVRLSAPAQRSFWWPSNLWSRNPKYSCAIYQALVSFGTTLRRVSDIVQVQAVLLRWAYLWLF